MLRPLRAALAAGLAGLILPACESAGIRELRKPLEDDPALRPVVDPGRLSPASTAVLRELGLAREFRHHPEAVVLALEPAVRNSPPGDPRRLALAEILCKEAASLGRSDASAAVGWHLLAARVAYPAAIDSQRTGEHSPLLALYNHACGKVAIGVFSLRVAPGAPVRFPSPVGLQPLAVRTGGRALVDPADYDRLKIADYLDIRGYQIRDKVPGVGSALVAQRNHTPARLAGDPFLPEAGLALPVTATLQFRPGTETPAELAFHDVLVSDRTTLGKHDVQLAADFTAPLALLSSLDPTKDIGRKAMFHPARYLPLTGLYRIEPQRPDKIPVVLVHGLSKTPAVWMEAINGLRSDRRIRDRYQFLVFQYPSGLPAGFCAAALRHHLARYRDHADPGRDNPHHRRMVLVGKSFGGVISSFQIRDSGETFRELFAKRPLSELALSDPQRQALRSLLHFEPDPDISRVVFMVTPHRGTDVADTPLAKVVSHIIRYPIDLIVDGDVHEYDGMTDLARAYLHPSSNSMVNLRPHSPDLETVRRLPTRPGLPIHSIIGKVGHGPLAESDDKMVPYWSSHLDEAVSERIVPTKHGHITHHPDAIAELRRILLLHLEG